MEWGCRRIGTGGYGAANFSLAIQEDKMKTMRFFLVVVLALGILNTSSCLGKGDDDDNGNDSEDPNFVQSACAGCPQEEALANGFRFFSYVKNVGGSGKIGMTISNSKGSATKEFNVVANTTYVFSADVPAVAKSSASFTYIVRFPGKAGYTDTRTKAGFDCTGAPTNLRLEER